ncbi:MAG: two pore domain potassium channel family protein [Chloroflexaceae bacterium]|nr:two pore domain potassium channel family protein [Chloroflexaceae bacterium]
MSAITSWEEASLLNNSFLGFIGIVLVSFIIVDVLWTTLRLHGGGPITERLANGLWRLALLFHKAFPSHRLLAAVGFGIILLNILVWFVGIWLGWTCVFMIDRFAVLNATTNVPASFVERAYYVGYSLITLGLGDFEPNGGVWQILTVVISTNGFFFVTLIVTYLLPLLSAATERRTVASYIYSLGNDPVDIVANAWNGADCNVLSQYFTDLMPSILSLSQQDLAYPIVFCFHNQERENEIGPAIATLGEVLLLLEHGLPAENRIDRLITSSLWGAIGVYLSTLDATAIDPADEPPPLPNLAQLRERGVPTVSDSTFCEGSRQRDFARKQLLAQLEWHGWYWDEVRGPHERQPVHRGVSDAVEQG